MLTNHVRISHTSKSAYGDRNILGCQLFDISRKTRPRNNERVPTEKNEKNFVSFFVSPDLFTDFVRKGEG